MFTMSAREVNTEDDVRRINYYSLGRITLRTTHKTDEISWTDIEVGHYEKNKDPVKFRFYDIRLLKYFVTKLKQANFRRKAMDIKYGNLILMFFILCFFSLIAGGLNAETAVNCINEELLSEDEKNPSYNLLSFPAVSTGDPDIVAVSYFNNKLNIITRENYVTQYEYSGVPYSVYRSFLDSADKMDYYERCIEKSYDASKVY